MGKKSGSNSGLGSFKKGDRVFAKIKGFPHWPARIETVNSVKKKFEVVFYGTYQKNVLKWDAILPFNEDTKRVHGQKKQKSFVDAMAEIEQDDAKSSKKK